MPIDRSTSWHSDPHPSDPSFGRLLDQYLAGELSEDEQATVRAWLDANPLRRRALAMLQEAPAETPPMDAAAVGERIERGIDAMLGVQSLASRPTGRLRHGFERRVPRAPIVLSSVAVAMLVIGLLVRNTHHHEATTQQFATRSGQRATVPLADGSIVLLAPSTSMTVSSTVSSDAITIHLTGEAYFTVAPHAVRALTVETQHAVVRVLGTRFGVRQYPNESDSRVIVDDGKVSLSARQDAGRPARQTSTPVVLSTRMLGIISDSTLTVTSGVATERYTGWTEGKLVFNDAPMRDVARELARAYGADIRLADSVLAREPVSMTVSISVQTLPEILGLLVPALDAHYTRVGQQFVIAPGRAAPVAAPRDPRAKSSFPVETQYGR